MPISDIPIFSMLRTRMQWHQERQRVLAENVANADTPRFRPQDLKPLEFGRDARTAGQATGQITLASTDPAHITAAGGAGAFATERPMNKYDVRPAGNAVNLEEEMLKVSQNQSDFQLAASLYQKSLQMLRIAAVKR